MLLKKKPCMVSRLAILMTLMSAYLIKLILQVRKLGENPIKGISRTFGRAIAIWGWINVAYS